jgi:hypothetical protein
MPSRDERRRIGLLLPSSNTTQEAEFNRILPTEVTTHVARLSLHTVDLSSTARVVEDLESEGQKLADADVDAIVLAATAPSPRNGIGYDQELIRRIEAASGHGLAGQSPRLDQALRRLRRWPPASFDRRSARRGRIMQAGTEKRRSSRTEKLRAISVPASRATINVSGMPARWRRTICPSILE